MNEILFTNDELIQIIEKAKDPEYSRLNLFHIGSNKLSIRGVSQTNGLILVYGNEWTGYMHIDERHSYYSRKPYWNNNKMDNPTKFSQEIAPINYLFIASQIFKPENKNFEKNTKPELFDLFIGFVKDRFGKELEYKLILYKDTKVIHTFYVNDNKKPFNKKKIINLRQGWVSSKHDLFNGIQTFEFSYFDSYDVARFKVIIRYIGVQRKEKWYIQANSNDGSPRFTAFVKEFSIKYFESTPSRMIQLDFVDVFWIEKIIKTMIEEKYPL
ncbi:MAG: hypothetical protein REI96_19385 [Flavobacterium nitrogenifigens]|uniref:hypothetical protein n=1 Tax=Flavobacterium nitrogenifigens TaxID=1617283 RepID=UPI0028091C7B|nr:hypothetical protein [Flavobacterium nitrogenifigens]MDQ8014622.1 hypothetical protein [Flavobacterium nitrogenifigens]